MKKLLLPIIAALAFTGCLLPSDTYVSGAEYPTVHQAYYDDLSYFPYSQPRFIYRGGYCGYGHYNGYGHGYGHGHGYGYGHGCHHHR